MPEIEMPLEQARQEAGAFLNAEEHWPIYDTIQIRSNIEKEKMGYTSYVALSGARTWPFFDQRKTSDVGLAYTNRDNNESNEFAYECYSIGVRFIAPQGIVEDDDTAAGPSNKLAHALFATMIDEHVGLSFKVSQDFKLQSTCTLVPEGAGKQFIFSVTDNAVAPIDIGAYPNTNGVPQLGNRWVFPVPIEIPRTTTFKVELVPSDYALNILSYLPGPGNFTFSIGGSPLAKPACALIRVDLFGKRGVQRRNSLHFGA